MTRSELEGLKAGDLVTAKSGKVYVVNSLSPCGTIRHIKPEDGGQGPYGHTVFEPRADGHHYATVTQLRDGKQYGPLRMVTMGNMKNWTVGSV